MRGDHKGWDPMRVAVHSFRQLTRWLIKQGYSSNSLIQYVMDEARR